MALFEVPGWTVPSALVAESSNSRKRKRPDTNGAPANKIQSAAINVEKLMKKLSAAEKEGEEHPKKKGKKGNAGGKPSAQRSEGERKKGQGKGAQPTKRERGEKRKDVSVARVDVKGADEHLGKKNKKNQAAEEKSYSADNATKEHPALSPSHKNKGPAEGLTTMQANMKQSLDGARFRWINETLYKSDSAQAVEMMRENPSVFTEYHTGFRHQVHLWPINPVSHYISTLSSYDSKSIIVDLGCGDAALARALVPNGLTVLSYDLVSDGAFVVHADICSRIPLPGGEDADEGEDAQVVQVVVCALSLMSTNWVGCIREAWRILKPGGELKIAEVASRFTEVEEFTSLVSSVGFKLRSKDDSNTHFTLFEFTKVARKAKSGKEWSKLMERGSVLKPCEYKRR